MKYAITYPEKVEALVLVSSAPADYEGQMGFFIEFANRTKDITNEIKALSSYEEFYKQNEHEISDVYKTLYEKYLYDPKDVNELNLKYNICSARSGFKVLKEMSKTYINNQINLLPELKKLNIPTLVLHGKQDVVPLWTAKRTHEAIKGSKMIVLDECGHFPYVEKKELFNEAINGFIEQVPNKIKKAS